MPLQNQPSKTQLKKGFLFATKKGGPQPFKGGALSPNQNTAGKHTDPSKQKTTVGAYSAHVLAGR
jgi:hypothetical protein